MGRKKILSVFLVCVLCISMGCGAAAEVVEGNLLVEPGFVAEPNNPARIWGWSPHSCVTLNTDLQYVRSTPTSMCISTTTQNYPSSHQYWTRGLIDGAEYTASIWIYALDENTAVGFKYSFLDKDGNYIDEEYSKSSYKAASKAWEQLIDTFRVPKGTVKVIFAIRMNGKGTAYVDDVNLEFTDGPEKMYAYSNDGTFYYTERTEPGKMHVEMDTEYYPSLVGQTVQFMLSDGADVKNTQEAKIPKDGKIDFTFSMDLLEVEQKAYTVSCAYAEEGKEDIIKSHTVYKFKRPTRIDDNGFFRDEKNEIFTPHFMYSVGGNKLADESVEEWLERDLKPKLDVLQAAGINCVQLTPFSSGWKAVLDELDARGMKCLVVLYSSSQSAGHKNRINASVDRAKSYMGHDAVFGWLIYDEPATSETALGELVQAYTEIRKVDPEHPIVITANGNFDVLHQYTDILIQDSYPYNNAKFTTAPYDRSKSAVEASGDRPVYALLQTFEELNSFPQQQEVRNMQYASLWAGVKGIGYYEFLGCKKDGTRLDKTELWTPLSKFGQKEWTLAQDMFLHEKCKKVKEEETDTFTWGVWKENESYLVLLRNKKYNGSVSAEIPVGNEGERWQTEAVGGTAESVVCGNGEIIVTVAAGDVILLRVSPPDSPRSLFSGDANANFEPMQGCANEENFSVQNDGSLHLISTEANIGPRIFYDFPKENEPKSGKSYILSFWFKPSGENREIRACFGTDSDNGKYVDFAQTAFTQTEKSAGWTEYSVSFTMPQLLEDKETLFILESAAGLGDGYYDFFALTEDTERVSLLDTEGNLLSELTGGETARFAIHHVAEYSEADSENLMALIAVYRESQGVKECVAVKAFKTGMYKNMPVYDGEDICYYKSVGDLAVDVAIPACNGALSYKIMYLNQSLQAF